MVLTNGQWQGGGEDSTLKGSELLTALCRQSYPECSYFKVAIDTVPQTEKENHIVGYYPIIRQSLQAKAVLTEQQPETLFTIGGGCDADLPSIAYLNERYHGDLTVFWFDAHGDLNSPDESESGLFYGMPARILMQPEYDFMSLIPVPVKTQNWVQLGGRDFDSGETAFIKRNEISFFDVNAAAGDSIENRIRSMSGKPAYIHFDLDVLDPLEFSDTPLPVLGGMRINRALEIMQMIKEHMNLVGLGLFEYKPNEKSNPVIQSILDFSKDLM